MKSPRPQQLHVGVPCFLARNLLFVGRMMSAARVFVSKCSCCSFVCLFMTHNWFRLLVSPRQTITNFNTSYRNIVGRSMLRAFGRHVATCCFMLGTDYRTGARCACPPGGNIVARIWSNEYNIMPGHATSTHVAYKIWPNMLQHVVTLRNRVAKRSQHEANNIFTTCCVEMLRSLCRGFMFVSDNNVNRINTFSLQ